MTLQIYPSTPKPSYSYKMEHGLKTEVLNSETGMEMRNRRWRFPVRIFQLLYKLKTFTVSQRDAITDFYYQRYGSYEAFWFFDFQSRKWIDQYMGRGDGTTRTFDVPGTMATAVTIVTIDHILLESGDNLVTEAGDHVIGDGYMVEGGSIPPTVYVNGTEITSFGYLTGTGEAGVDQVVLGMTPSLGSLITCDFTGYLRIKGRFKDDKLTEEIVTTHLDNLAVSIYEVKN